MKNRTIYLTLVICGVAGIILSELVEVHFYKILVPALIYVLLVINRKTRWWHMVFEGIMLICLVLLAISKSFILSESVFLISIITLVLYASIFLLVKIRSRKSEYELDKNSAEFCTNAVKKS